MIASRGEACHVADNPASKRDQRGFPGMPLLQQTVKDPVQSLPVLEFLAIGQNNCINTLPGKAAFRTLEIQGRDSFIGHNHDLGAANKTRQVPGAKKVLTNKNGVAAIPQFNRKFTKQVRHDYDLPSGSAFCGAEFLDSAG